MENSDHCGACAEERKVLKVIRRLERELFKAICSNWEPERKKILKQISEARDILTAFRKIKKTKQ